MGDRYYPPPPPPSLLLAQGNVKSYGVNTLLLNLGVLGKRVLFFKYELGEKSLYSSSSS
jgi:hypothetical protein